MGKPLRRLRYWSRRAHEDAELAEEMEFHRVLAGPRAMGQSALAYEDARAIWIWPWIESIARDLACGLRERDVATGRCNRGKPSLPRRENLQPKVE